MGKAHALQVGESVTIHNRRAENSVDLRQLPQLRGLQGKSLTAEATLAVNYLEKFLHNGTSFVSSRCLHLSNSLIIWLGSSEVKTKWQGRIDTKPYCYGPMLKPHPLLLTLLSVQCFYD